MKDYFFGILGAAMLTGWCVLPVPSQEQGENPFVTCDSIVCGIIIPEHITDAARAQIQAFEGCSLTSYPDNNGGWAIGYGHFGVSQGLTISQYEAERLFDDDIQLVEDYVINEDICHTQESFDAIVSFVYNIGISAFSYSTVYELLKYGGTDEEIRSEIRKWIYADGKVSKGLVRRRNWEAKAFYE